MTYTHYWLGFLSALIAVFAIHRLTRVATSPSLPHVSLFHWLDRTDLLTELSDGFLLLDHHRKIRFVNPAAASMLASKADDLLTRSISSLAWKRVKDTVDPWRLPQHEWVDREDKQDHLMLLADQQGSQRLLSIAISPLSDQWLLVRLHDVTGLETYRIEMEALLARARNSRTEMEIANQKLQSLIQEDALTGCRNRRALTDQVNAIWQQHYQTEKVLGCLMIDIDHFKRLNDDHGHATGDEALRQVGKTLMQSLAGVGKVYRYGGEEFCVLLPGHDLQETRWIAERIRMELLQIQIANPTSEEPLSLTASLGVSDSRQGATMPLDMIRQADKCLYMAKRKGRNCVIAWSDEVSQAKFRAGD